MDPKDKKIQADDVLVDEEEQEIVNEDAYLDSLIAAYTDDNHFDIEDDEDLYKKDYWDD